MVLALSHTLSLSHFCQWLSRLLYVLVQAGLSVVIQVVAHPLLVAEVVSPWRHIGHRCERFVRSVDMGQAHHQHNPSITQPALMIYGTVPESQASGLAAGAEPTRYLSK